MHSAMIEKRRQAVSETVEQVRRIETEIGVTRAALSQIEQALIALTNHSALFDESEFPNPSAGSPAKLYLLSEDPDHRFALYLTCALPGGVVRPHNHGTWAVVAGLSGCEENKYYECNSGGATPGPAIISPVRSVRVGPGESTAMLPDDIHSVATPGAVARRHFHMYGLSLEHLPRRLAFDLDQGSCSYMEINPKIVRSPNQIQSS